MRQNANALAWAEIFTKYEILERISRHGYADVQAAEIKEFREPRLMGKVDHEENLPPVFANHGLTILTISNSAYRIGPYEIFQKLPEWTRPGPEVSTITFPNELETLDHTNITSEPSMLNIALASGILEDFCEEELTLTLSGRMRTGQFEFVVDSKDGGKQKIPVDNAQMEIDAGYEGRQALHIFEAKNHSAKNFNLRQIYYPSRSWSEKITKPVRPVFITHSNDVFDLFQFEFENWSDFSSGVMQKHRRYMLTHQAPDSNFLIARARQSLAKVTPANLDLDVPFPQADSFEKVIDLVAILLEEPQTVEDLATHFSFDPRQSDYYYNAAKYLGLAGSVRDQGTGTEFRYATTRAQEIFAKPYLEKYRGLASLVLSIQPVARTYIAWTETGQMPEIKDVAAFFRDSQLAGDLSRSTIERRSATIRSWAGWLVDLAKA